VNFQTEIDRYVYKAKIPIFAITRSDDFEHALPGWQPKDLMPGGKSMIIFGLPFIEHPRIVDEKTHIADESWWIENIAIFEQIASWRGHA
jgi:hypothetical protein